MYNDSYAAEKAYDNLYDRNEDVQPKDCGTCGGSGKEYYSTCCGAPLDEDSRCMDEDCGKISWELSDNCPVCKGEGVI